MVRYGFSLRELRHLYIDELMDYYRELVYIQEKSGELKDGSYEKLKDGAESTVKSLRKQIFKINHTKK